MLSAILAALLLLAVVTTGGLATTAASLAPAQVSYVALHSRAGEILGSVALVLFAWLAFSQPKLRTLSSALAIGVAAQSALGLIQQTAWIAALHSCLAQALAAGALALIAAASPAFSQPPQTIQDYGWPSLRSLSILLPAMIALQVALGAAFRHRLLGLMPHVIGAMLVSIFILVVGSFVLQQCKDHKPLATAGRALMVVTFFQVFLGLAVFTVRSMTSREATPILLAATAHVVTGAVLLGVSVVMGMLIRRNVVPKA